MFPSHDPDTESDNPELPHPDFRVTPNHTTLYSNLTSIPDIDFHRNFHFRRTTQHNEEYLYVWLQYVNQSQHTYAELFTFQISLTSSKFSQPLIQNSFG